MSTLHFGKSVIFLATILLFVCGGWSLAANRQCDFNGDGYADLAIGLPTEDLGTLSDAGAVNVLYGREGGLSATNNQFWTRSSPNVPGEEREADFFGYAVVCGDFNGDKLDD